MSYFDETEQTKKIQEIHNREEEVFVQHAASKFGLPYIDLSGVTIDTDALTILKEEESRSAQIAAFRMVGKDLYVAVKSPNLPNTKEVLNRLAVDYTLGIHMVSEKSLVKAWARYQDVSKAEYAHGGMLDISPEELEHYAAKLKKNIDIEDEISSILADESMKKTSTLMGIIFGGAIATKSSDVHIEAQEDTVRIRFRQDGVLQDIANIDHATYEKLLSRIKLLSEMKLTQRENAQDGRFTINFNEKVIEVRVSVIPSAYGESFVMRILNPDGINQGIESLGIEPRLYQILLKEIEKPNGMILTTGPTGSGKTTTLYSFLRKVYNPEVKILTIEDPIEYHLTGISQTQVNRQKDYTFQSGLRAALRQDPDIIMVGEIRDNETATIAVNASLTGHLVLSTLHTNSAAGVIPRLIDLGVSPQILAAALSVSIAQRLVRRVCPHCSYKEKANEEESILIQRVLQEAENNNKPLADYGVSPTQEIFLTKSKGCELCNGTGYKGRIGIYEAIITDELIEELLSTKPSEQEVRRVAEKQGLLNMREDGAIKIINGMTTLDEVTSVVDMEIKNFHPVEAIADPVVQEEKVVPLNTNHDLSPESVFSDQSLETSLLLDYLRKLIEEQTINPDANVLDKIAKVQATISNLVAHPRITEVMNIEHKDIPEVHTKVQQINHELMVLQDSQKMSPTLTAAPKLQQIHDDLEGLIK